jgi:hypothetical protein
MRNSTILRLIVDNIKFVINIITKDHPKIKIKLITVFGKFNNIIIYIFIFIYFILFYRDLKRDQISIIIFIFFIKIIIPYYLFHI